MSLLRRRTMMEEIGSGGMIRGSFTPETNLTEYSIELERECKNLIVQKNTTNLGYGVRTLMCVTHIDGFWESAIGTNNTGIAPAGYTNTHYIEFSGRTVTVKGSSVTAPGYIVPEQYDYIAW